MGINRYGARRDANEDVIKAALEQRGLQVWRISGKGVCDLLCASPSKTFLVEVKQPNGTLTKDQRIFWGFWVGEKYIVHNEAEVLAIPL